MQSFRSKKPLSLYAALLPLLCLLLGTGIGYGIFGMPTEIVILFSACVAGIVAYLHGWSWAEILQSIIDRVSSAVPTLLTLLGIGALVGAWMAGGTIPLMTYAAINFIDPEFFCLSAFVITGIISCFTGNPLLALGMVGPVMMTMAIHGDMYTGLVAGALVSGAYLGDRISPLSQAANIAAVVTGTGIYTHLKHMLWTSVPAIAVSLILFMICGSASEQAALEFQSHFADMAAAFEPYAQNSIALLTPVIILIAGTALRMPTLPVIMLSVGMGILNAMIFQGVAMNDACTAVIYGFKLSMLPGTPNEAFLRDLFEFGGMATMLPLLLIICCAFTFAGTMMISGAPMVIFKQVFKGVKDARQLTTRMLIIVIGLCGVTANGRLAVILPGIMLKKVCMGHKLASQNLSRTVMEAGNMTAPLLPWTTAAFAVSGLLGVSTFAYLPWAVLNWVGLAAAFVLAAKGLGMTFMKAPAAPAGAPTAPATAPATPAAAATPAAPAPEAKACCADKAEKKEEAKAEPEAKPEAKTEKK